VPGPKIKSPPSCEIFPCFPMCDGFLRGPRYGDGKHSEVRESRNRHAAYPNAPQDVIEETTLEVAAFLLAFGRLEVRDHVEIVVKLPIWVGIDLSLKSSVFCMSGEASEYRNLVSQTTV
jgi:hypothetical protein